ncbi:class F sortase [Microbacterium sp. SLBN-146]|uniref:class F sortase n=1 Tax=Microbacterium sp. SLBN-146 TaxID=2768457 RepID=UPI0011758FCD|nr:class F sortase [Microbacterium sp. SLBN-146]TQJ30890.1 sortase family protein [Microbacterium sp. SLBN-146]
MIPAPRAARHPLSSGRVPRTAGALTITAALILTGCGSVADAAPESTPRPTVTTAPSVTASPTPTATIAPLPLGVAPARVTLPAIGLDEPLIDLGIAADGSMEVPSDYDDVGWFTGGGRPGGHGPLVIAGHVDSPTGVAVFMRLRDLVPGDAVEITDAAGTVHSYVVTETADYPKSAFPTAQVFGAVPHDELRLITCGGVYDRGADSYVDNRVVYAVRADA